MPAMKSITFKDLNEAFEYDQESGSLFWKVRPRSHFGTEYLWKQMNAKFAGKRAGSSSKAKSAVRRSICIFSRPVLEHRLVYAIVHGLDLDDVPQFIDHIDRNPSNNRHTNLRPATSSQNLCNRIPVKKSGLPKGVFIDKRDGVFFSVVQLNGVTHRLGRFKKVEDAAAAYRKAATDLHGEFACF